MNRTTSDPNNDAAPADASRRHFLMRAGTGASVLTAGLVLSAQASEGAEAPVGQARRNAVQPHKRPSARAFWPNGIRLVISVSMMFEAGGQPAKGTDSPFPKVDFPDNVASDAATNTWFAYGYREGIPRLLDLWDRHGVKVTSHMIGEAAKRHPAIAKEIVARGHEAAAHGPRWSSQYAMSRDEERQFLIAARVHAQGCDRSLRTAEPAHVTRKRDHLIRNPPLPKVPEIPTGAAQEKETPSWICT